MERKVENHAGNELKTLKKDSRGLVRVENGSQPEAAIICGLSFQAVCTCKERVRANCTICGFIIDRSRSLLDAADLAMAPRPPAQKLID